MFSAIFRQEQKRREDTRQRWVLIYIFQNLVRVDQTVHHLQLPQDNLLLRLYDSSNVSDGINHEPGKLISLVTAGFAFPDDKVLAVMGR